MSRDKDIVRRLREKVKALCGQVLILTVLSAQDSIEARVRLFYYFVRCSNNSEFGKCTD